MTILLDLEATCWGKPEKYKQAHSEIIEISAVNIDDKFNIESVFSELIKPIKEPILSDFCINLTRIDQRDINNAKTFCEVMERFDKWVLSKEFINTLTVWGNYDELLLKRNLKMNNIYKGEIYRYVYTKHINNLQSRFESLMYLPCNSCSLSRALSIINEPFHGDKHSSLNDVKNLLKIYQFVNRINNRRYIQNNPQFKFYIEEIRARNFEEQQRRKLNKEQKILTKENKIR